MAADQPNPASNDNPAIPNEELKKAYQAFKNRLKLARLEDESRLGHGPMSSVSRSGIMAIQPPSQYPQAVWDELVRQGRLRYVGHGLYEPASQTPT